MTTAKELLAMIEAVKPDGNFMDKAKRSEKINSYVECYLSGVDPQEIALSYNLVTHDFYKISRSEIWIMHNRLRDFCNDRNALKAIRPDGWLFGSRALLLASERVAYETWADKFLCRYVESPLLPTEELSELHAIIQAIEWERQNVVV